MRRSRSNLIRASEVGEYVYCARAWRLRLEGHQPTTGASARIFGEQHHLRHGRAIRRLHLARKLTVIFSLLSLVAGVLLGILWWFR